MNRSRAAGSKSPSAKTSAHKVPNFAADEDFAQSGLKSGLAYSQLIERVIRTGLKPVRE